MTRRSIDDLLAEARSRYRRVDAMTAARMVAAGALLVDIRPVELRRRHGEVPAAVIVDRNQLEWRLDPACSEHLEAIDESTYDRPVILFCDEGYASSLAVLSLRRLGLSRVTDIIGGFQAWSASGAPVSVFAPLR